MNAPQTRLELAALATERGIFILADNDAAAQECERRLREAFGEDEKEQA